MIINNFNLLEKIIDDICKEKIIRIGKPRKFRKRRLKEKLLEKQPIFTLCLLAKCKEITDCWDLKEYKFIGVKNLSCPRLERIRKITLPNYFAYRLYRYGKPVTDFSDMEISLIILAIRYYLVNGKKRNIQMEQLMRKLENCVDFTAFISRLKSE